MCYTDGMKHKTYRLPSLFTVEKLVTVYYFEFSKNFHCQPESHDFWELHYVDKGAAVSIAEDEEILLGQGDILFHRPMAKHQLVSVGDGAPNVCVISFVTKPSDLPFLESKKMHLSTEERSIIKKFLAEAEEAFLLSTDPAVQELFAREDAPAGVAHMMKLHLEELLLLLMRDRTKSPIKKPNLHFSESYNDDLINEMVGYMREHLDERLTIAELCRRFSYGKTHLCSRFAAATGKSINRYFTELKITAAKQVIRENNFSREMFARLSDALGFNSPAYFYTTFKKITGMTPTEYSKSVHQYDKH